LNDKINEDGDELIDLIRDPNEQSADILLNSREELNKCLANVLRVLSERERIIIEKSFGINGVESSLEDLGEEFNCTKERVRQLKDKALKKLRNESFILSKYL
jgi:RNA polymerase primary sigma factor